MHAYRNAAIIIGSLLALGYLSAGEGSSTERSVFLVTAAVGVLGVLALALKALREEN